MTAAVWTTTATVDGAVYRTDRHASVNLVYHMDDYAEEKRTEVNCTVNLKPKKPIREYCARRVVLLKLTADRYKSTRGLSATAELLVW